MIYHIDVLSFVFVGSFIRTSNVSVFVLSLCLCLYLWILAKVCERISPNYPHWLHSPPHSVLPVAIKANYTLHFPLNTWILEYLDTWILEYFEYLLITHRNFLTEIAQDRYVCSSRFRVSKPLVFTFWLRPIFRSFNPVSSLDICFFPVYVFLNW